MDPILDAILNPLLQVILQGVGIALPLAAFLLFIFRWLRGDVKGLERKQDTTVGALHDLDKRVVRLETLDEYRKPSLDITEARGLEKRLFQRHAPLDPRRDEPRLGRAKAGA